MFILNGTILETDAETVSYEQIRELVYPGSTGNPTCVVVDRFNRRNFSLLPGQQVTVSENMRIEMIYTNDA